MTDLEEGHLVEPIESKWMFLALRLFENADAWIAAGGSTARHRFKLLDPDTGESIAIKGLARILGISGDPKADYEVYLAMGRALFGEVDILKSYTSEEWIQEVQKIIPTAEAWAAIEFEKNRRSIVFESKQGDEVRLQELARILGLSEGNPVRDYDTFLELGRIIFGSVEILTPSSIDELKALVRLQLASVDACLAFPVLDRRNSRDRKHFKVVDKIGKEYGIDRLATRFGAPGRPASHSEDYIRFVSTLFSSEEMIAHFRAILLAQFPLPIDLLMAIDEKKISFEGVATRMGFGSNTTLDRTLRINTLNSLYGEAEVATLIANPPKVNLRSIRDILSNGKFKIYLLGCYPSPESLIDAIEDGEITFGEIAAGLGLPLKGNPNVTKTAQAAVLNALYDAAAVSHFYRGESIVKNL